DVTRYALNCFGGAGGQHACLVADALGMTKVLIHPFSSLLSAYGMGLADIRATREQAMEEKFAPGLFRRIVDLGLKLAHPALREVTGQGVEESEITGHVRAHVRYSGTDTALEVPAFSFDGWIFSSGDDGIFDLLTLDLDERLAKPLPKIGRN